MAARKTKPVQADPVKTALDERQAANRQMMLHYIRGEYIPEPLRIHWDMRGVPIIRRVRAAMAKDRAPMTKAEAYLDAELARR